MRNFQKRIKNFESENIFKKYRNTEKNHKNIFNQNWKT